MACHIFDTPAQVHAFAARAICQAAADSINIRGQFLFAVGVGPDVEAVLALLPTEGYGRTYDAVGFHVWSQTEFFLADEAHAALLGDLVQAPGRIRGICTEAELRNASFCDMWPSLDLILLGPNDDGEIGGLPPGFPVQDEEEPCVVNDGRRVILLTTGDERALAYVQAMRMEGVPAAIRPEYGAGVCWVVDLAAESCLGRS